MNNLPPFEPPYQAISAEFGNAILEYERTAEAAPANSNITNSAKNAKFSGPVTSAKASVFFLVVPFAEKEDAKGLGARWDAMARKWYVPLGKDLDSFKRWMPKE